jgi:putative transposase
MLFAGGLADRHGLLELCRAVVSSAHKTARKLLSLPAVPMRRQMAEDAELLVLRHESAELRRQLTRAVR